MKIEWDPKKAKSNLRKHRVSFEEAATALSDPMAATGADPDHSITEERYITFGVSGRGRLLVVAHTDEEETIRIISARIASKGERELYEEG
ncbi:MAG: BrnT family toxin [Desulfobacteria bacterium]